MTTIEQLAKEFSNGNPAIEAALIAMGRKVREQDIELIRSCSQYTVNSHMVLFENGYEEALEDAEFKLEELL
ncbi:hypothetical protein [Leptospira johnsonii]|uniref:Uncharacterized protein n=1 Tax=Leptospira johnsonii TaxID=1917820 RepID=A0A2P2D7R4_9LEPT|nr:hypothetical protein [Leptospira johnsonii]GBF40664.1 hypothetical protein LPTSP1_36820 [Leptospira johnsonii]